MESLTNFVAMAKSSHNQHLDVDAIHLLRLRAIVVITLAVYMETTVF